MRKQAYDLDLSTLKIKTNLRMEKSSQHILYAGIRWENLLSGDFNVSFSSLYNDLMYKKYFFSSALIPMLLSEDSILFYNTWWSLFPDIMGQQWSYRAQRFESECATAKQETLRGNSTQNCLATA